MSHSNTYVLNLIVSLDGNHVMSQSDEYAGLTEYFATEEFSTLVNDRDLDKELLAEVSQGLTNHLRAGDKFDWSKTCVAVVSRAAVNALENVTQEAVDGEEDNAVFRIVMEVGVLSSYEP